MKSRLRELALLFLKLGTIAFGGPAGHIAMMEDEVVRRRQWLSRQQFLDYLGATNLIPGPNSTELAIHIGHARAGWPGLVVAGVCFIVPAALIVTGIAWGYVRHGTLPAVEAVLYIVKPVVIAVVVQALVGLGRTALRTPWLALLGAVCVGAVLLGVHELLVLLLAGLACAAGAATRRPGVVEPPAGGDQSARSAGPPAALVLLGLGGGNGSALLMPLFLTFVKIGSVLFGSGYVLLAFLRADFVERLGWITEQQLLDAIVVGQLTPGPVFTTATFIGYLVLGPAGALVATLGIFLPAFVFVAVSGPLVPRLRRSRIAAAVLDGVNVASLALMAVVTWQLAHAALVDVTTIAIGLAALALLHRLRAKVAWIMLGALLVGLALAASGWQPA